MTSIFRYSAVPIGVICAICAIIIGLVSFLLMTRVSAADDHQPRKGRLVTVHDRGQDRVILTDAHTIKDALGEAGIHLDDNDTVEPAIDEKLVANSYYVNIYRARPVIVVDGAIREKIMTPYQTADKIAADAGLTLHDEDKTTLKPTEDIISQGAGLELKIDRATPFSLVLYGKKTDSYTQATTVADMLKAKNIKLGANDTLSLDKNTPITAGMTVEIWRNGKQTVTEEQPIAFETEKIKDVDREVGYREVKTLGVNGKKSVTYEIEMKNGQELARKEIQVVVLEQPKKQVEIVGSKLSNTFSGSFAEALARLRSCEGKYTSNTGNGYYGAYQFDKQTWGGYGGYAVASDAPPAVQDEKAWLTYQRRGWQPWPSCSRSQGLQDIYR